MPTFLRGVVSGQHCGFPMDLEGASIFERIAEVAHL